MYNGAIYFLGLYRPAYYEAETLEALRDTMEKAIAALDADTRAKLTAWIHSCKVQLERGYSSASIDHGHLGVAIKAGPHDPWLGRVVATMAPFPALTY